MLNKNKDKVLFSDQDVKNVLHKKISGKKDTQTTLLGHITLKSSDISNFIYISWRNRFERQKDVYSVLSKLISTVFEQGFW